MENNPIYLSFMYININIYGESLNIFQLNLCTNTLLVFWLDYNILGQQQSLPPFY